MSEEMMWRFDAKCGSLPPSLSDIIFFPGSGGKATKAKRFCQGCPVISTCLQDAMVRNLQGFIAGTTYAERQTMVELYKIRVQSIEDTLNELLPERAKRKTRRVYRKIVPTAPDTLEYLDTLKGPELHTLQDA